MAYNWKFAAEQLPRLDKVFLGDFIVMGRSETGTHLLQLIGLMGRSAAERARRISIARSDEYGTYLQSFNPVVPSAPAVVHTQSFPKATGRAHLWEHLISVGDTLPAVARAISRRHYRQFGRGNETALRDTAGLLEPLPSGAHRVTGSLKVGQERLGIGPKLVNYAFMSVPRGERPATTEKPYLLGVERGLLTAVGPGVGLCLPQYGPDGQPYTERPFPVLLGKDLTESMKQLANHLPSGQLADLGGVAIALASRELTRGTHYMTYAETVE